jgi:hypothetical protein
MQYRNRIVSIAFIFLGLTLNESCDTDDPAPVPPQPPTPFKLNNSTVDGKNTSPSPADISLMPEVKLVFSAKVKASTVGSNVLLKEPGGANVSYTSTYQNADSVLVIKPMANLKDIATYNVQVLTGLQSQEDVALTSAAALPSKHNSIVPTNFPALPMLNCWILSSGKRSSISGISVTR